MSATAISTATFDYADFEPEAKGKLISLAGQIRSGRKSYNAAVFKVGESIAAAHAILAKKKTGTFGKWIKAECGLEETTAANYMHTWQTFGDQQPDLPITTTAMYLLSAPQAPPKAAKEAIKRADRGEKITVEDAKELLDKFRETESKVTPKKSKPAIIADLQPVESKQVTEIETSKSDDKPTKISGGTSFNTEELEAAAAPKPPKNGSATKPEFDDAKCKAAFVSLVKMLDDRWDIIGGTVGHRATATKHLKLSFEAYEKWVKG